MQSLIDASIAKNAPMEELVDQPEKERGIVRVSGPFTVEALPNVSAEVRAEVEAIPSDVPDVQVTLISPSEAENVGAFVGDLVEMLRKTGVNAKGKKLEFESLHAVSHEYIHAEGEVVAPNGNEGERLRTAVIFGPRNGAVSEALVVQAAKFTREYDAVLFCGYDFTAPAQEAIKAAPPGKKHFMAHINADTAMSDLLKNTKGSQIFTLLGEPDIVVYRFNDPNLEELLEHAEEHNRGEVRQRYEQAIRWANEQGEKEWMFIELRGVDLYDPVASETRSDKGENVHAVFIDHDYDGKSFCIGQALFPNKSDSWVKIARNLKGTIDEEAFEAMRSQVSMPFKPGERVQVKVIDAYGNAVVKTVSGR